MQTAYTTHPEAALAGQLADSYPSDIVSGHNEDDAPVGFGLGVVQGTGDDGFALPSDSTATLKGVTVHDHRELLSEGGAGAAPGDTCALLRKGRVFVVPDQDVAPGDDVYWRYSEGGTGEGGVGSFRKDADTVETDSHALKVTSARWVTTASAGGLAVLEINLP